MAKNILHIIGTRGPGGAETVFINLVRSLNTSGTKSLVVIEGKGWVYDEVVKSGIIPTIIESSPFGFRYLFKLVQFVKKNKISLIHSHLLGANVYCCIAGIICKIPVISTFHGTVDINPNDKLLSLKFKLVNRGSRKIVFVSEYLKKYYLQFTCVDRHKSTVIYNGINSLMFEGESKSGLREELDYKKEHILIGSVGNIRKAKGYDVLLKVSAIVRQKHPECRFIIIGKGDNELFEELALLRKNLGVESVVKFLGFRSDVSRILKDLDIFLLPSTTEGFSISTIEAMAAGVPVIVTDSGGPGEIVANNKDGIIVPPNNAEAIAVAIHEYISNREMMLEIVKQATLTVKDRFSIDKTINAYTSLYNEVLF